MNLRRVGSEVLLRVIGIKLPVKVFSALRVNMCATVDCLVSTFKAGTLTTGRVIFRAVGLVCVIPLNVSFTTATEINR